MESSQIRLAISFLNAGPALGDPLGAATWWNGATKSLEHPPLLSHGQKPRFNGQLSEELQTLCKAGRDLAGAAAANLAAPLEALDTLNRTLGYGRPSLVPGPPYRTGYALDEPSAPVLLPLALAIAELLQSGLHRLRRCKLESCSAYLWDVTKNRSRRWCSLACMERDRAPRRRLRR